MRVFLIFLFAIFFNVAPIQAEDNHQAERQQLKIMLTDIEQGINGGDIELMAKYIDAEGTVTWLNAEVSKGPSEVRDYFKRMVGHGKDAVLSKYETHPKIDQTTRFYDNVAIASGTTEDTFTPHERAAFKFTTRWTATLLQRDGEWKIASLSLTTNSFNNALTQELERYVIFAGAGGAGAGLLTGLACVFLFCRNRKKKICTKVS